MSEDNYPYGRSYAVDRWAAHQEPHEPPMNWDLFIGLMIFFTVGASTLALFGAGLWWVLS